MKPMTLSRLLPVCLLCVGLAALMLTLPGLGRSLAALSAAKAAAAETSAVQADGQAARGEIAALAAELADAAALAAPYLPAEDCAGWLTGELRAFGLTPEALTLDAYGVAPVPGVNAETGAFDDASGAPEALVCVMTAACGGDRADFAGLIAALDAQPGVRVTAAAAGPDGGFSLTITRLMADADGR
jgi:hypothetical protein